MPSFCSPHILKLVLEYAGKNAWLPCALICRDALNHMLSHVDFAENLASIPIVARNPSITKWLMSLPTANNVAPGAAIMRDVVCGNPFMMTWLSLELRPISILDASMLSIVLRSCNLGLVKFMIELEPQIVFSQRSGLDLLSEYVIGAHQLQLDRAHQERDIRQLDEMNIKPTVLTVDTAIRIGSEALWCLNAIVSARVDELNMWIETGVYGKISLWPIMSPWPII